MTAAPRQVIRLSDTKMAEACADPQLLWHASGKANVERCWQRLFANLCRIVFFKENYILMMLHLGRLDIQDAKEL
jgi:hypothetical protein